MPRSFVPFGIGDTDAKEHGGEDEKREDRPGKVEDTAASSVTLLESRVGSTEKLGAEDDSEDNMLFIRLSEKALSSVGGSLKVYRDS